MMRAMWCTAGAAPALIFLFVACSEPAAGEAPPDLRGSIEALARGEACSDPRAFAPEVLSSASEEWRVTFTPDGATAFFGLSDEFFPIERKATIMTMRLEGGAWTEPEVAPFSGVYSDIDPFVAPDGERIYFSSIRPIDGQPREDADLWMVERSGDGWSEPKHLGAAVNSPADELYPSVTADGALYFGSDRDAMTRGWDIFRAEARDGVFGSAQPLAEGVNTEVWEFNPWVSADDQVLVFTALDRPGGAGLGDLWASFRGSDGTWGAPLNLGPCVNTPLDEYHPSLDRERLYFVRHSYEPWVPGDLHEFELPPADP